MQIIRVAAIGMTSTHSYEFEDELEALMKYREIVKAEQGTGGTLTIEWRNPAVWEVLRTAKHDHALWPAAG